MARTPVLLWLHAERKYFLSDTQMSLMDICFVSLHSFYTHTLCKACPVLSLILETFFTSSKVVCTTLFSCSCVPTRHSGGTSYYQEEVRNLSELTCTHC